MQRILYLHGLESKQGGAKVNYLASQHFVYAPALNYREPHCFEQLYNQISTHTFDIFIGSSMGGYFAFELSKVVPVKNVILLNPALPYRSIPMLIPTFTLLNQTPHYHLHLGKNDPIINPQATIMFLEQQQIPHQVSWYDYGHRTPIETIIQAVQKVT